MIPVLFKGNETNFNHNGIGLLKDTLSCEVSEIRNGSFDLELVYPITGPYFKDLKNGNIIQAKPNDTDQPHNFRITEIDKTLYDKEVVVYGVSTTNDLGGNMVKSLYLTDVTPQVILNEMKNVLHYPTPFNFVSNITTVGSVDWSLNNPLNLIVGEEGSLVDIFGGEVKRTNDTLFLYGRRGKDNVTTIRAGKNLNGFKMTESFQGKYTQILPYFKYEAEIPSDIPGDTEGATTRQEFTVFGSIVSSPYHGRYPVNAIKPIDFSQNEYVRELKTLEALNEVASGYFSDLYSEIDKPSVSINVDMIQLVDSEQYALYEKLEKIELTDTVSVYVSEYDVDVLVKITELKYDSLRERTISIVASSSSSGRTSLMDEISGSYKQFTTTLVDDKIQSATSGIINQILTKKDGSNMYAGRATPPENSKPGDIWFKDTGGGDVELYEFDGVNWVRKMYKGFGDDVRQLVDDKIAEANVTITEVLEEHDNTIAQALTNAGQANNLAQQAKTEAENASLSASRANQEAETIKNELETAKTNLQNQVDEAQVDINQQAQTILDQAQAQTALTSRVTTVETLADGTKTTVAELSKTVDKATGDITSVTNRTKVVEDSLDGVKTNYTQLSQTVNTQTGQIETINRETADLQSGIDGVTERFDNLRIGGNNLLKNTKDFSGEWDYNGHRRKIAPWKYNGLSAIEADYLWEGLTQLIQVRAGEVYTFSSYVASSIGFDSADIYIHLNDHRAEQKAVVDNPYLNFNMTSTFQRVSITFKVITDGYIAPRIERRDLNGILYFAGMKLERGTIATDWSQPIDDATSYADAKIAEYKRTADQNYAGLESTVSTLDGKVTQNKTTVDQLSDKIELKAERTYVDTVKQTVDSTTSRVTLTEQSITGLVSGVTKLPDGRTSVFATKIESLEGAITQRVTTQELNNRGYQTSTDVTNTINNRTDLARKTDIPTTSGGRNLAQKTSSEWSTPYTSFYGTTNNCPNLYKIIIDDLAVGDKLKSRIVLKYTNITSAIGQTATIWLQGSGNVTGWSSGAYNGSPARAIVGSGEMIFEHEFTITADHLKNAFFSWAFRTDYIASGSLQWKLAKVEKGPLWTAWTPAHEDAEASITDKLTGYVTNQTYTTYTTDRQQTDGQITEQINQTVSKVPTGPVNLIVNGFDPKTISPWTFDGAGHNLFLATHDFFYNSQKKLYMLYTSNTNEGYLWTNVFNLKRNTKYTIRLGLFAGSATKSCDIYFMGKPSGGSFSYQLLRTINDLSPSKVVYYTITFDSGSFDLGQFRIDNNGSWTQGTPAALYICEVSCIEGEYNNSWTPSFDELITEQKFNETKSTVDAFSRAIGTRDETGFVPNIARLVMTQDAVISEVAKYGEHNNNLVQDSVRFSTTIDMNGSSPTIIEDGNITWRKFGSTTYTWAGIGIPVNVKRFIAGEKYTLSFEYYLYQSPDADIYVEIKDHTNNRGYCYGFIANTSTPINTYHYFQQTFTIDAGTASNTIVEYLYFYLIKNGDIGIRNVMLVRGEKIGPYSTSQVDSVTSRVEQTANSYSVKFLNNANDITTQLNLTSSGARIKSSLIHLDGNVTVSGTAWMDGAIIKNLSADKITTGTLNANNVNITNLSVNNVSGITSTYLQSVIGDAFIDWMRGKMITAMNGNMAIDLNNAKITFNADAKIQFNSADNALFRTKNGTSAFIHFRDDAYNGVYTAMGVNADNSGTQNDYASGSFAGVRVIRTNPNRYSGTIVDQVQIVADEVRVRHTYGYEHDYLTIIWDKGSQIDLVKWMRQFNTNFTHLVNLTGRGDVIKYF